ILRFTNLVCRSGNISSFPIHTCRLKALQRNKVALFFNATSTYLVNHITGHFQFVKKANGYKPWLYNISADLCEFLRKRNNPIINMVLNIVKNNTNLIHPCPFKVSLNLVQLDYFNFENCFPQGPALITGLYLKPNTIPLPMPTGEYGILTSWKFDKIVNVDVNVYFEFIEDL
ncbi:hypothetical protein KR044_008546, partial [Drosophila immigrans]